MALGEKSFWWVSQNQTFRHEFQGGYMWSPQTKSNGSRHKYYDFMTQCQPGDVVFSYVGGEIRALGTVTSAADVLAKPEEFGKVGDYWHNTGWYVAMEYQLLENRVRPGDHMAEIGGLLPKLDSPLRADGIGNQQYLFPVPEPLAWALLRLIGSEAQAMLDYADGVLGTQDTTVEDVFEIQSVREIAETERTQLVKSRIGQGIFRANVRQVERACRITGVDDLRFLRASHIKPWKFASNSERLDGANGLMLSPHVDHLFDQGWVTFEGNGEMVVSRLLPDEVLLAWSIDPELKVGTFTREQANYLQFHNLEVFKGVA